MVTKLKSRPAYLFRKKAGFGGIICLFELLFGFSLEFLLHALDRRADCVADLVAKTVRFAIAKTLLSDSTMMGHTRQGVVEVRRTLIDNWCKFLDVDCIETANEGAIEQRSCGDDLRLAL